MIVSHKEFAATKGLHPATVAFWCSWQAMPHTKRGAKTFIDFDEGTQWMIDNRKKGAVPRTRKAADLWNKAQKRRAARMIRKEPKPLTPDTVAAINDLLAIRRAADAASAERKRLRAIART